MRWKLAAAVGVGALLVAVTAAPANASTNTITVGPTGTVTNRILVSVSVTIVCDPLPDTPFFSGASVTVQQANGKQVSTGTGGASTFSGPNAHRSSHATVSSRTPRWSRFFRDPGSGPFKGGGAVVTARFDYQTPTGSESGSTLATVRLRG